MGECSVARGKYPGRARSASRCRLVDRLTTGRRTQAGPGAQAATTPDPAVAIELSGAGAQKIDQVSRVMERVSDDPAVREPQRREGLAVDLGQQDRLLRSLDIVQGGEPCERYLVVS